jgi:hypothetical protein
MSTRHRKPFEIRKSKSREPVNEQTLSPDVSEAGEKVGANPTSNRRRKRNRRFSRSNKPKYQSFT